MEHAKLETACMEFVTLSYETMSPLYTLQGEFIMSLKPQPTLPGITLLCHPCAQNVAHMALYNMSCLLAQKYWVNISGNMTRFSRVLAEVVRKIVDEVDKLPIKNPIPNPLTLWQQEL